MNSRKKIVVLSGAGISAESGIRTFRDTNGLWEDHSIEDVATPEGWQRNPDLVLEFYNQRRKQAFSVQPNDGHRALAGLEAYYNVVIITQNVDNLHERAGSTHVIHLHGELSKVRSTADESLIYERDEANWEVKWGDVCGKGSQLRPHIVWFGEAVPMMDIAVDETAEADIFIVVGTSLQVYPAAGLLYAVPKGNPIYIVDPHIPDVAKRQNLTLIPETATSGLTKLARQLMAEVITPEAG